MEKSLLAVDWSVMTAQQVYNLWRALPASGALKVHSMWQDTEEMVRFDKPLHPDAVSRLNIEVNGGKNCDPETEKVFPPGRAVYVKAGKGNRFLCIKCASGWIGFTRFTVGTRKKVMAPVDFFNGFISRHRHKTQFFVTPSSSASITIDPDDNNNHNKP